jgi:hypothetical protein
VANPKQFDGLRKLINTASAGSQVVAAGAAGGALSLGKLDELVDAVKGGKPDMLLMSRRTRRKLNALVRAANSGMMVIDRDSFGNFVELWDGIPIGTNDWILDTHTVAGSVETAITGGSCSTIYALQLGEGAVCGLTSPGHILIERIGALETKDASSPRSRPPPSSASQTPKTNHRLLFLIGGEQCRSGKW